MQERRHTATQVLVHWVLLLEALALISTGFYLHHPTQGTPYGLAVFTHLGAAYALFSTAAFRAYWSFFGDPAAWGEIAGSFRRDLRASLTHYAVDTLIWVVLAAQTLTGLALRFPTEDFFARVIHQFGGIAAVRIVHYILTWTFVSVLAIHAYQTLLSGRERFSSMFIPVPAPVAVDEDDDPPAEEPLMAP